MVNKELNMLFTCTVCNNEFDERVLDKYYICPECRGWVSEDNGYPLPESVKEIVDGTIPKITHANLAMDH